jgi:hypothetical protein
MRGVHVAIALLLMPVAAEAATQLTAESRDLRKTESKPATQVLWLDGPRLRLDLDAAQSALYRADTDTAWWIDHRERTTRVLDGATTAAVAQRAGEANAAARRYLEALSPARRAAAERLLDRTLGPQVAVSPDLELRSTGASDRIAGVPCDRFEVRRAGALRAEGCRAAFGAAGVSAESRKAVRSLSLLLRAALPTLAPAHSRQDAVDALQMFEQLDGVPLWVRLHEDGAAVWETRVTAIAEGAAPEAGFEPPAGYARGVGLGAAPATAP